MTFVITEPCIGVKEAACVEVCPCDCIHPRPNEPGFAAARQLFIDPEDCTECGACEPECPVGAIFLDSDVPPEWQGYIALNAAAFERARRR